MLLKCICLVLIATVGFGQDLGIVSLSTQNTESDSAIVFRQNSQSASQSSPANSGPAKKTVKGKSHRKLWITLAVALAGAAVTSVAVLNKTRG